MIDNGDSVRPDRIEQLNKTGTNPADSAETNPSVPIVTHQLGDTRPYDRVQFPGDSGVRPTVRGSIGGIGLDEEERVTQPLSSVPPSKLKKLSDMPGTQPGRPIGLQDRSGGQSGPQGQGK